MFDSYTKAYEAYKGNRTLYWRPFIGRVELEIEIGNKKIELTVSPIHAVVIHEFQKQSMSDFYLVLQYYSFLIQNIFLFHI